MKKTLIIAVIILITGLGIYLQKGEEKSTDITDETTVTNFEQCVKAGNLVMESYPRQCRHGDRTYVENIDVVDVDGDPDSEGAEIVCTEESKKADACIEIYAPVCGLVEVQCITTPCPPVKETFGNSCSACARGNVISYTEGECEI